MFFELRKVVVFSVLFVGCLTGLLVARNIIKNNRPDVGEEEGRNVPDETTTTLPLPQTTKPTEDDARNCSEEDFNICITKDCTLTAAMLISALDTSFDPCDNFYDFTCANFIKTNPVPDGAVRASSFMTFRKDFDLQLKNLLEGINSLKGPNAIYRLQEFYHVCINTTYQQSKEVEAFRNFTRDTLDWPLASGSDWQPRLSNLSDYMAVYEAAGFDSDLASIGISLNDDDSTYKVEIKCDNITDMDVKILDEESPEVRFIKDVLHLLGNDDDEAIAKDFANIKQLITNDSSSDQTLQENLEGTSESLRAVLSSEMESVTVSIELLNEITEQKIDWLTIINGKTKQMVTFNKDDPVTVRNPMWLRRYFALMNKTPLRTVLNLIGWRALATRDEKENKIFIHASQDLEDLVRKHKKAGRDTEASDNINVHPPRWKKCLTRASKIFMLAVTREFLEKHIDRSEKKSADEMIQLIQKAYINNIRQSDWLDEETKRSAILKAEMIERYVGYPDFIFDDVMLDKYYENTLPTIRSTLFENEIEYYTSVTALKKIPHVVHKIHQKFEEWEQNPLDVNAFYNPYDNSIWFPAGILQLPFFQDHRLAALNFGMIGSVIGHEVGHAFDNSGRSYDEKGNVRDWWTSRTTDKFEAKSQCFVQQYNAFCPEFLQAEDEGNRCISGRVTLGENLADYTGLNAAFEAYRMWTEKHGAEKRLPGLQEFTPEQLFFIGNSYLWCENVPADKWLQRYNPVEDHAPGRYRSIGSLSNTVPFREAFHCPPGPMNRAEDSCTMW